MSPILAHTSDQPCSPTGLEVPYILLHIRSAHDAPHAQGVLVVPQQTLGGNADLHRELTSRREDEDGGRGSGRGGGGDEALDGRDEKGEGLACSGFGLREEVAAGEYGGESCGLDLIVSTPSP